MGKDINKKKAKLQFNYRTNSEIKFGDNSLVRIVYNEESRVVSMRDARKIGQEMGLDLVEINGALETPIIKICDYEKMLYSLKKSLKNKKNSHPVKEIHLTTNIAEHDIETKCTQAKKFLEKGLKVKVILTMKGRELLRREDSKKSLLQFIVKLSDISVPEFSPKDEGNRTIVILKKKN